MKPPSRIDLAAFVVTVGGTVLLASDQGGFFSRSWPWAGIYFAAVGGLVLLTSVDLRINHAALFFISALAVLCGWTVLSWFWSAEPSTSLHEALRTPVYLAAAIAFVILAAAGGSLGLLVGVAAGTTAVAAYSLIDLWLHGFKSADQQAGLLEVPLGYANALGVLCGIGLVVGAALGIRSRNMPLALLAAASAAVLVTALALTHSRGAWLAVAAGTLIVVALGAGGRRWAVRAGLLIVLLMCGLFAITAFGAPGFLAPRGDYWHAAWEAATRHPLGGTGAGTFDLTWAAYGDPTRWGGAVDAHNLYLETLSELGLVGLVVVAALTVPVVAGVRTARPSAITTAALGGAVTYLVHTGLDWDWEMPAVTVTGIACIAATLDVRPPVPVSGRMLRITLLAVDLLTMLGYIMYLAVRA